MQRPLKRLRQDEFRLRTLTKKKTRLEFKRSDDSAYYNWHKVEIISCALNSIPENSNATLY